MTGAPVASHRPIDVLEPLAGMSGAFSCSPGALSSWAMAAGTGRRCVYARVPRLGGALAERARSLARTGAVQINQVRSSVDRDLFDHIATRTARPFSVDPVAIDKLPQMAVDILDLLERCAAQGMKCPSNWEIAVTLSGLTAKKVSQAICQLRDAGLLRVEVINPDGVKRRTITIVGTGETLCSG